jgi:hypothetical protein
MITLHEPGTHRAVAQVTRTSAVIRTVRKIGHIIMTRLKVIARFAYDLLTNPF